LAVPEEEVVVRVYFLPALVVEEEGQVVLREQPLLLVLVVRVVLGELFLVLSAAVVAVSV
jgi:hypothetical protein